MCDEIEIKEANSAGVWHFCEKKENSRKHWIQLVEVSIKLFQTPPRFDVANDSGVSKALVVNTNVIKAKLFFRLVLTSSKK